MSPQFSANAPNGKYKNDFSWKQDSYDILEENPTQLFNNLNSTFPIGDGEIDPFEFSLASHYLSEKITKETKRLFKITSTQLKKTTTYQEGVKFLDELQGDFTRTKDSVVETQSEIKQLQQVDDEENVQFSHSSTSTIVPDKEHDGTKENVINRSPPLDALHLSEATAFIADTVVNETRKMIKITGEQIKKTSKYQDSVNFFDDLCDDYERNSELRDVKVKILNNSYNILSCRYKDFRKRDAPELFDQFICGLINLKRDTMFYETYVSAQEMASFRDTIKFSFEESIHSKSFYGKHNEQQRSALNFYYESHICKPEIPLVKDAISCSFEQSTHSNGKDNQEQRLAINCHSNARLPELSVLSKHLLFLMSNGINTTDYNMKFLSFIKLCNDLFSVEDIFPYIEFDYFVWQKMIILFVKANESRSILFESFEESSNQVNVC